MIEAYIDRCSVPITVSSRSDAPVANADQQGCSQSRSGLCAGRGADSSSLPQFGRGAFVALVPQIHVVPGAADTVHFAVGAACEALTAACLSSLVSTELQLRLLDAVT